ncbi:hypothetical protein HMPREF9630_01889 [Peptoanaerobacter stomatis]|uniref:Uncharacterized protein n=1 Tax=Peptoanaerobacter stomatis TaxID=796937 RepID=V9HUP1_9FIRM|nr:hypothetical protein [Peptoanaerobacter stomatis]EHL16489.1 hypothetical protein HMPREF9630_01889 [Peptoanaerobacter stomatis]
MRVGRINLVKFMPYRDVKMILRYFAMKGVAQGASKENDLSKINTLQPYDDRDIKQQIKSRNALNDLVLDTIEDSNLNSMQNGTTVSAKSQIRLMKAMRLMRKGSKVSGLDLLAKSDSKSAIMNTDKTNVSTSQKTDTKYFSDEKVQTVAKEKNIDKNDNQKKENISVIKEDSKKETKTVMEEYADLLKRLDEKKEQEKKDKDKDN